MNYVEEIGPGLENYRKRYGFYPDTLENFIKTEDRSLKEIPFLLRGENSYRARKDSYGIRFSSPLMLMITFSYDSEKGSWQIKS
ncbi:MAG: hypothetical protein ACI8T1_001584 [Verrucomicrobiales bacterium]|jgi:hypothetical protein